MDRSSRTHGRRAVIAGAAGLGLASIVGGSLVVAQATPDAGDDTTTDGTTTDGTTTDGTTTDATAQQTDRAAEAAARYADFTTKLAANLGNTDSSAVDTAIRATLTDIVDDRLAAGEISANDADAAKSAIASSSAPFLGPLAAGAHPGGLAGHGGGFLGGMGRRGDGRPDDPDTTDSGTDDATPAATV